MKKCLFALQCLLISTASYALDTATGLDGAFKRYQNHVVAIYNEDMSVDTLTGEEHPSMGTGFVIDPVRGLVATNYHVFSHTLVAAPHVAMTDGTVYEPESISLLYSNPTGYQHDFAIFKINGFEHQLEPMEFERDPTKIPTQTKVGIMGCNEGVPESLVTGYLADKYNVETGQFNLTYGSYPSYTLSAAIEGGSSGSPVFTGDGKVIGINAAGTDAHAFIIPIYYILDVLGDLTQGKIRNHYSLGIDLQTRPIHDLKGYRDFRDGDVIEKIKETPDYRQRALEVSALNPLVAKEINVKQGDVLKKADGQIIGPDYYKLHQIVYEAGEADRPVKLTLERFGKEEEVEVKPWPLKAERVKGTDFHGMWIFPANQTLSYHYGIAPNLPVTFLEPGALLKITKLLDRPVMSFDEFVATAHQLISVEKRAKLPLFLSGVTESANKAVVDVNLSMAKGKPIFVIRYDDNKGDWVNVEYSKYLGIKPKAKASKKKNFNQTKAGSSK